MKNIIRLVMQIRLSDVLKFLVGFVLCFAVLSAPFFLTVQASAEASIGGVVPDGNAYRFNGYWLNYQKIVDSNHTNVVNAITAIEQYKYHNIFLCAWKKNGQEEFLLCCIGANTPIKYIYENGEFGVAVPSTNSTMRLVFGYVYVNPYSGERIEVVSSNNALAFETWQGHADYGYWRLNNSPSYSGYLTEAGVNTKNFFYTQEQIDNFLEYQTGWIYCAGTGANLYDSFESDDIHQDIVTEEVGKDVDYSSWYGIDVVKDGTTGEILGIDVDFDFGYRSKMTAWLQKGFIAQFFGWIDQGFDDNFDQESINFGILGFHTSNNRFIKSVNMQDIELDFSDDSSLCARMASVLVPVIEVETIIALWVAIVLLVRW